MNRPETRHTPTQAGRAVHAKTMTVETSCSAGCHDGRRAQAHRL